MAGFSPEKAFDELRAVVEENSPNADFARIRQAFDFAVAAHAGQVRKDGSPYVTHAIAAAEIAGEMGLDEEAIMAALRSNTCIPPGSVSR